MIGGCPVRHRCCCVDHCTRHSAEGRSALLIGTIAQFLALAAVFHCACDPWLKNTSPGGITLCCVEYQYTHYRLMVSKYSRLIGISDNDVNFSISISFNLVRHRPWTLWWWLHGATIVELMIDWLIDWLHLNDHCSKLFLNKWFRA